MDMTTMNRAEIETVWAEFHIDRIPGHDMSNECRLAAAILVLRDENRQLRKDAGQVVLPLCASCRGHVDPQRFHAFFPDGSGNVMCNTCCQKACDKANATSAQ